MKSNSPFISRSRHLLSAALALVAAASPVSAMAAMESPWSSRDGITILARLDGWDGSQFLMERNGRHYRTPPDCLSLESLERACRQLGLRIPARQEAESAEDDPFISVLPPKEIEPVAPIVSGGNRTQPKRVSAPANAGSVIRVAVAAANRLQDKPYKWGGGHSRHEDTGYDCSGSVSYVLMKAGLLRSPGTSRSFMKYGHPGPGRWITIYARNGHVFMTICGLRLDTGGHGGRGESGPRWRYSSRSVSGFVMRHPPGF